MACHLEVVLLVVATPDIHSMAAAAPAAMPAVVPEHMAAAAADHLCSAVRA